MPELAPEAGGGVARRLGVGRRSAGLVAPVQALRLRDRPAFWAGLLLVAAPVALALAGPALASHDPYTQALPPFGAPSRTHWLGTDQLGRDLFARLAAGGVRTLGGALVATVVAVTIGLAIGVLAAVAGGRVNAVAMRAVDALNGIPALLVPIALVGALGPSYGNLLLAVVIGYVPAYVRIAGSLARGLAERPDVVAARMMGVGRSRIAVTHVGRAIGTQMLVITLLDVGSVVTALAGLSFLGMGAQPPTPEWGAILDDGQAFFSVAPWLLWFPVGLVTLLVLGSNLVGESVRDAVAEAQGGRTG